MKSWNIAEIFYSLQGEGRHSGRPVIFIRLGGCNLSCSFCDEKELKTQSFSFDQIVQELKRYNCRHIVLTGGEPLIQKDIEVLIQKLFELHYEIHIESNGTVELNLPGDLRGSIWLTISPKTLKYNLDGDEYKFLYDEYEPGLQKILNEFIADQDRLNRLACEIYVQPVSYSDDEKTERNIQGACKMVMNHSDMFTLSLQIHKFIGIR